MFNSIEEPLGYVQKLCAQYTRLSHLCDSERLLQEFALAAAELTDCELGRLYLLDATHTRLQLCAEAREGVIIPMSPASLEADCKGEQLLQFCLCQNQIVSVSELSAGIYDTGFLPTHEQAWKSLLCVPLVDQQQRVAGLLLCAGPNRKVLDGFAESLGELGAFVLSQLQLLQRLQPSASPLDVKPSRKRYGLIGQSEIMHQTCHLIGKVLQSSYTVLLTGETGTGKEVVARAIHDHGPRRSRPFVVQNCTAFPEGLLESELFGYCRGAFTGADRDRAGLFDTANGGTLLLDEIGDMPLSLQAKLLRVLQEGEIRPLGSSETRKVDVRIIAATHRNLLAMVAEGLFREDLYYRLAQFPIELPPLRHREGDIAELARHFADKACHFLGRAPVRWSEVALLLLCRRNFPGNVRELKGLVERAVLLCEGNELLPEHFSFDVKLLVRDTTLNLKERLEQVERCVLLDSLRKSGGNRSLAARQLGLARRTLLYRMSHLNIKRDELHA
ncbi:sigma 54-interacting transcriptional regulator [Pseudomonas cichorii]|nr:sigma 54-interacting transcriptional regulator [Pseudomonas cichorii]MBX8566873.1 sigma 54-interacting transcriptional regulator [Pseudomonas cichorii]MBX8568864.1 sigma 54-interacting transcriptional regulator [Pseudomonas cichorii]